MQVFAVSGFDKGLRLILLIKGYATLLCDHTAQIWIQLESRPALQPNLSLKTQIEKLI